MYLKHHFIDLVWFCTFNNSSGSDVFLANHIWKLLNIHENFIYFRLGEWQQNFHLKGFTVQKSDVNIKPLLKVMKKIFNGWIGFLSKLLFIFLNNHGLWTGRHIYRFLLDGTKVFVNHPKVRPNIHVVDFSWQARGTEDIFLPAYVEKKNRYRSKEESTIMPVLD